MTQVELSQAELNDLVLALVAFQSSIKKRTYESVFTDKDGLIYSNDKANWEHKQKSQINRISKLRKKLYDINILEMQKLIKK
jgi:hypothetical protein